jgi:endoglucanase
MYLFSATAVLWKRIHSRKQCVRHVAFPARNTSRVGGWFGKSLLALGLSMTLPFMAQANTCESTTWPLWQTFGEHFVQADGRVLDASTPQRHSSSESMSYGMFFALVANDRMSFDRLWNWAQNNLAAGDISTHLPAWFWGLDDKGAWRVLDDNSASDADLWFAYALLEAGRLWQNDEYTQAARKILHNVVTQEVADLPGLGKMLLPGFRGFVKPDQWMLNPSYMPIPLLRRFAEFDRNGPWAEIATNTATLIKAVSYKGFVADWVSYRSTGPGKGEFIVDPVKGEQGGYDAIRVYLWAGITPRKDPLARPILNSIGGMLQATLAKGVPPEKVQVTSGQLNGSGPWGFSAALLPYLDALGQGTERDRQAQRVQTFMAQSLTPEAVKVAQPPYYHFVLGLFALGYMDQRYQFLDDGKLQTFWGKTCSRTATQ